MEVLNEVEKIVDLKVLKVEKEQIFNINNLEILENTALYNKEMTISVELLSDGKTLYATTFDGHSWNFEGYYQEKTV